MEEEAWWEGMPRLSVLVDACGDGHTVTLERGEVVAEAHTGDDDDTEAMLVALGGDVAPCRVIAAAVTRGFQDDVSSVSGLDTWGLWAPPEPVSAPPFTEAVSTELRDIRGRSLPREGVLRTLAVRLWSGLPGHWHAVRLARALAEDRVSTRLGAQLETAAGSVVRGEAQRADPSRVPGDLEVEVSWWSAANYMDGTTLHLHPRWLGRVWARGGAVIDGHLVLDLRRSDGGRGPWVARCLDRRRIVSLPVRRTPGGWTATS